MKKTEEQITEEIPYIEFYLAGDTIFKCQQSWLPTNQSVVEKVAELAIEHGVSPSLIKTRMTILNLPVQISKELLDLLDGKSNG